MKSYFFLLFIIIFKDLQTQGFRENHFLHDFLRMATRVSGGKTGIMSPAAKS